MRCWRCGHVFRCCCGCAEGSFPDVEIIFVSDTRELLLQAEIENFIVKSARLGTGQGSKRGRENCDPDASAKKNAKVECDEKASSFSLSENGLTRCGIKEFKGNTYVDIRTHYKVRSYEFP